MASDLAGSLQVVTGGGSGIGRAVCIMLADAGARIVIADMNVEAANETKNLLKNPGSHAVAQVDVSIIASVKALTSQFEQQFNTAPVGVTHCAGIILGTKRESSLEISEAEYDRIIDTNMKGTFLVNTEFIRLMLKHKIEAGSIVNLASIAAKGLPPLCDYAASKAGVVGITKTMAQEFADRNIRVNALAPSFIDTPLIAPFDRELVAKCTKLNPSRRTGTPEEVASVCVFLLSKKLSNYVTGQIVGVDGGESRVCTRDISLY